MGSGSIRGFWRGSRGRSKGLVQEQIQGVGPGADPRGWSRSSGADPWVQRNFGGAGATSKGVGVGVDLRGRSRGRSRGGSKGWVQGQIQGLDTWGLGTHSFQGGSERGTNQQSYQNTVSGVAAPGLSPPPTHTHTPLPLNLLLGHRCKFHFISEQTSLSRPDQT